ncbi:MAG: stage II sporulation protein M [Verrucomicrobiae bacterium]|nr:stage II sporulation protein M [Verrucomicrobiae bacterium]
MIVDLQRFLAEEQPVWAELESMLERLDDNPSLRLGLHDAKRFYYLYQRTSADLAQLATFNSEPQLQRHLESLVARAYSEIHETRRAPQRLAPLRWFFVVFPQTFRRHSRPFLLSTLATLAGCVFGACALLLDPSTKTVLIPLPHLQMDPTERVALEEQRATEDDPLDSTTKTALSGFFMTHNTRVSIFVMALGMTAGIGTLLMLFYNGLIIGAVAADYVAAGHAKFLLGWLLPHGAVEIPAVLIAGQAGLLLAGALIGWRNRQGLAARLQQVAPDLVTLIGGVAVLLAWAGCVEAFLSQYHEPVIPYGAKIGFGLLELALLSLFLGRSGAHTQ